MYLRSRQDLQDVLESVPSAAVILNQAQTNEESAALPMGRVLSDLLDGPTHSFTALVGFFGHRVHQDTIERYTRIRQLADLDELKDEDLAELIVHEAVEENIREERDIDHAAFRLLVGAMASPAARDAARAWYWLCRYRHEAPEGQELTDSLRAEFIARAGSPDQSFVEAANALLEPGAYDNSPFNLSARDFVTQLKTSDIGESRLTRIVNETLFEEIIEAGSSVSLNGAGILLGFFLQRRTDFRLNPQPEEGGPIFHPKIYVVERGEDESVGHTGTIVGSHNWTVPGLGLESVNGTPKTNIEVATLHLDEGHHWTCPIEQSDLSFDVSLGTRVCGTARHLFDSADSTLGSWNHLADNVLPAHRLKEATESRAGQFELARDTESRETFRSLLVYLRHLVAGLSYVNLDDQHDEFFDRFRLSGRFESRRNNEQGSEKRSYPALFSGKIPASYQVDGAIRLLSILEGVGDSEGSRGAFLTDEAGLGKTLSAKMTLAILAATRLARRNHDSRQLKISLIVPAALTGTPSKAGRAPSGWHLHAREVRRATEALLADVCIGIEPDEAARLTHQDHLQIRVISQGIFSPSTDQIPDAESKEDIAADNVFSEKSEARLQDFQFIAESELVTIDESHAFRNQRSRRTRTLRLLLSLPVPGEESWPIVPPSGQQVELSDGWPDDIRRRVLCLSATPFNNRIEDIITQIGHFAQYQDWERPYGMVGQREFQGEGFQRPLDRAIEDWQTSSNPADRKDAFRTIVKYARRHLHRKRTLSVPADQLEEKRREGNTEELRSRYDDLGPEYIWPGHVHNYQRAFAKALEWLHGEENDAAQDGEELERKRFEARQELESVLTSLFVQRSRIRALRIIQAAGATSNKPAQDGGQSRASTMFRKPRRPRQPLALNRHHRVSQEDDQSLEAGILDNLFRLLYPDASDNGDGENGNMPHLNLKAYEISALRGQRSAQAARNAIGFQVTFLIKRLQSSPYSFFSTLIKGLFRGSLTELALVERLLDEAHVGNFELPETLDAEALRDNIDQFADELGSGQYPALSNLVELIKGEIDSQGYGRPSLASLVGLKKDSRGKLSHPEAKDVEEHFEDMKDILTDDSQRFLWDPEAAGSLGEKERQGWVSLLLKQVKEGTSSALWHDITNVLTVADKLSHRIWGRGNQNVGKPFDKIWRHFQSMSTSNVSGVADWLTDRLETDERSRTLMAWLLIQAAARTNRDDIPARALIRGGSRTLVFTEYKTTQDYLLALFSALHVVFRDSSPSGRRVDELRDLLVDEMRDLASDLHEQSQRVTRADTDRFHFADPTKFSAPVVDGLDGWLGEWFDSVEASPDVFATAVRDLSETFVRVHGDKADRLTTSDYIDPRTTDGISLEDLTLDSQVDAFSPWYQLEPESDIESPEEALGYVERLHESKAFPVYTLLTTDVLAEGVNLQECGVVVHFDLPWNPTKLIQRNGRIDRRLNPTFENSDQRSKLHAQLVEAASRVGSAGRREWKAPEFHPPEQVYHLTVLPIEPEVLQAGATELATRVRESLQEKLEAIRTLFGLSNWPIVLTHEDSQEVLTGELDFETPGFRRREDLFAALRQLEDGAAEANERFKSIDAQLSVHVQVDGADRNRLVELFADPEDEEVSEAWGRVHAAGIISWTQPRPTSKAVYSDHEWLSADQEDHGAISGVLVIEDDEADGGYSFVTWGVARETSAQDTLGRRILPVYIRPTDIESQLAETGFLEISRLQPLEDWNALQGATPSAPSELAADLVKTIIDIAVDGNPINQDRERKGETYPADDLDVKVDEKLADFLAESSFLNTVIDSQMRPVSRRPEFGEKTTVKLTSDAAGEDLSGDSPAFNLWVSFNESS